MVDDLAPELGAIEPEDPQDPETLAQLGQRDDPVEETEDEVPE